MLNWEQPQRQSAFGIFMFAGKALRDMIAVFIVAVGSLTRSEKPFSTWALWIGGIFILVFGKAILDYLYFRFHIAAGQLIINKGIFSKKNMVIPFERIQTVQLQQNLLHKLIGHCKVSIDTAGSEQTEVSIQAMHFKKAIRLKEILTQEIHSRETTEATTAEQKIIRLSGAGLMRLAMSANHLETFGLIIAFVLARFEDVRELLGIDAYNWVEEQGLQVDFTAQMISIVVFFTLAVSVLFSVVRILLRFADLSIHLTEKGFQLKHGLLSSRQQFIGTRKIQYILWKANWVRRKMGIYMFHVKSAGEDELKKKQRISVPVTSQDQLLQLTSYYQAVLPSQTTVHGGIQKSYITRKILLVGLPVTVLAMGIAFIWWQWQAAWLGLWLVYYFFRVRIYHSNFKIWANENAIELTRGVWGREQLVLNWYKLQVVTISQSIYQRRKTLATLVLHTASGDVRLPFLRLEEARLLADFAAMKIESTQKNWM